MPELELRAALDQLAEAELILRREMAPGLSYAFKHGLVQDAAYQSLLKSRRQQLHARIAEALEARFEQTAASEPELLAHHFRQAELLEQAVPYTIRAGDLASKGFAFVEARAGYHEALDLAHALPPSEQASRFQIRATLKLANVAIGPKERVWFIDWSMTIRAPVAVELGWFLVSNSGSLPKAPDLSWLREARSYSLPDHSRVLRPKVMPPYMYTDRTRGDVDIQLDGSFSVPVTLYNDKPGIYTIAAWIKRKSSEKAFPATEVCVRAE